MRIKKTQQEAIMEIMQAYRDAGQPWPAEIKQIVAWAYRQGLWKLPPEDEITIGAEKFSEAFRKETHRDNRGRLVRSLVCAPQMVVLAGSKSQQWLWDDIREAPHEHVVAAVKAMRKSCRADVRKVQEIIDSYNHDRAIPEGNQPIQLSFNFDKPDADELSAKPVAAKSKPQSTGAAWQA